MMVSRGPSTSNGYRAPVAVAAALAGLFFAKPAQAEQASSLSIKAMHVGDCQIVVQVSDPRPGDQVGVVVELTEYREQTVVAGREEMTFPLAEPLRQGFRVRARLNGADVVKAEVPAGGGGNGAGECVEPVAESGESPFDASAFFGEVVDTFAPDKVGGYRNPESGSAQKLQFIFGVNFSYLAIGGDDSPFRFWIEGETTHGVRTADVNCKPPDPADVPPVCSKFTDPNFADRARFILENATSLEAFISPRVDLYRLQKASEAPASLYVTSRIGFIALEGAPDVYRSMHVALGLVAEAGNFASSYIEAGWGKNELFSTRWNRLKVDGLLSFSLGRLPVVGDTIRGFVQMQIDNDLKDGPDSVRTYFGIDVDLKTAFGP